jgi:hypothetical protein
MDICHPLLAHPCALHLKYLQFPTLSLKDHPCHIEPHLYSTHHSHNRPNLGCQLQQDLLQVRIPFFLLLYLRLSYFILLAIHFDSTMPHWNHPDSDIVDSIKNSLLLVSASSACTTISRKYVFPMGMASSYGIKSPDNTHTTHPHACAKRIVTFISISFTQHHLCPKQV